MNNMDIWNSLNRPPPSALKTIGFGPLKGKSDISPQWRMQAMTEAFGPVGIGWTYKSVRMWTEPAANDQVFAFAHIAMRIKVDDEWSREFDGVGGKLLIRKTKNGLESNDEAFKMATTDALGVAMKAIGVAADIYAGLWDGSKYRDAPQSQAKPEPFKGHRGGQDRPPAGVKLSGEHKRSATVAQMDHLRVMFRNAGIVKAEAAQFIGWIERSEALTEESAREVIEKFEEYKAAFYKSQTETES